MRELGVLQRINVRDVWPHEARDFSTWLSERLPQLGEALNLSLDLVGREVPVGRFSVDIFARDVDRDRPVVIENQLEPTDHDHLGKLITYAAGLDAGVIIWISPAFCEEHRSAIDWLNNHTDAEISFFGVTLEAIRIDDSRPAVNFKVLAFPNGWQKAVSGGASRGDQRGDNPVFFDFFERFMQDLRVRGWSSRMSTSSRNYQIVERMFGNIQFAVAFSRNSITAQCVIDTPDANFNIRVFDALREQAPAIQGEVDTHIDWDFIPGRNRQLLSLSSPAVDRADQDSLEQARTWAVNALVQLKAALTPRLNVIVPTLQRNVSAADAEAISAEPAKAAERE